MTTDKPQIHPSGIVTFARCAEAYRRRYIEGEIIPPAVAMITGTATHKARENNLQRKIDGKAMMSPDEAAETARDALTSEWGRGVSLDADQQAQGLEAARGDAIDVAAEFAAFDAQHVSPKMSPLAVERKWVLKTPLSHDLAGTIDCIEGRPDGTPARIVDLKTAKKKPSIGTADKSTQLTAYALAIQVLDNPPIPPVVVLDHLVRNTKGVAHAPMVSARSADDFAAFQARLQTTLAAIDAGIFVPTDPSIPGNWICTPRFCGFFNTCKYVQANPVSVGVK